MNFSQDTNDDSTYIHSYTSDYLVIHQTKFDCHCQLHRDGMVNPWSPANPSKLTDADFEEILSCKPEVIILGTGTQLRFPDNALRGYFLNQGIGFEVMDTGAACRTYNILLSEGRNVAAAILLNQPFD